MSFCPECKYEYVEGITECPDCYVELVTSLDAVSTETEQDGDGATESGGVMVSCWDTDDHLEANAAFDILKSQSIPCYIHRTPRINNMYGASVDLGNSAKELHVMVPEDLAAEAGEVLALIIPSLEVQSTDDVGDLPASELDETYSSDQY